MAPSRSQSTSLRAVTEHHPIDVLRARGFIDDITDEAGLRALFDGGRVTFYVGFDPTASSLHIGHLVGLMAMAWLQRMGHRPIGVAGGGTGRIGDPSGRDDERELLDEATLQANLGRLKEQIGRVIDISDPDLGMVVDNFDWLRGVGYIEMLRDVGKHFSVNQMLSRESVRRRLEERDQGISYTEFSYAVLQAYDFAHLYATQGCRLQGGGSDQWGNITVGIDLTRRLHGVDVFGFTWPLIERSDGRKFSKSSGAAVWLASDETSPYAYYQWFLNVPDGDVERFLKIFTFLDLDVIKELVADTAQEPAARIGQRALAREATRIVHGDDGVVAAERATEVLFGDLPFADLDDLTLGQAFETAPSITIAPNALDEGIGLLSLLVDVGAAASNSEARRLVEQGGIRLNNTVVSDPTRTIGLGDLASETTMVLRAGKKRYFLVRITDDRAPSNKTPG